MVGAHVRVRAGGKTLEGDIESEPDSEGGQENDEQGNDITPAHGV